MKTYQRKGPGAFRPVVLALLCGWAGAGAPPRGDHPAALIALRDVSAGSGVSFRFEAGGRGRHDLPEIMGAGLALIDGDGDGRLDLFFCNGGPVAGRGADPPCRSYRNLGGGTFADATPDAHAPGPAYAMGAAVGDLDGDGKSDLVVTNFFGRSTVAFRAQGGGSYLDASAATGLTAATRGVNGFGLALVDLDGDGRLDLAQANGHVLDRARLGVPFAMRPTLLRNAGGRLDDASAGARLWSSRPVLGRGLAVGDLDGDGRPDLVVGALDAPAAVLRNESPGRSVAVALAGGRTKHTTFGARLRATVGGRSFVRDLPGGGSYLSASDRRVYLGLGDARRIDRIDVTWPGGAVESWTDLPATGPVTLIAGTGRR